MQNFIGKLFRFIIKLVLAAFGVIFAISFLFVALILMVLSLLKSLITWTKPTPFVIFSQYKQFKKNAKGGWPTASKAAAHRDVVDVEVREIKDKKTQRDI